MPKPNNRLGAPENALRRLFAELERFSPKQINAASQRKNRSRHVQGWAPLLDKTNICRFSSARLKLMTRRECDDRENGIGLCTRGPERPDICFGRSVLFYSACVRVWMPSYRCLKKAGTTDLLHIFIPCLFERLDRACSHRYPPTPAHAPPLSSHLCFGVQIMELSIKEAAPCILFFCDLHQPLFVFTTTTPRTRTSTISLLPAPPLCLGRD